MKLGLQFNSFVLLAGTLLFFACSSGGDDPPVTPTPDSITLTVSSESVEIGQVFSIQVTTNLSANVTASANITVNGSAISGNSFIADQPGNYAVRATYLGLTSNTVIVEAFDPTSPVTSITLVPSDESASTGTEVTFTVFDSNNEDITAQSTIFADGVEVTSLTSDEARTYTCYATYESFTSSNVVVEFVDASATYVRNVLIEEFTGTWCGFCPRLKHALNLLENEADNYFTVAIHGNDEFDFVDTDPLNDFLGIGGFPDGNINRTTEWTAPESDNLSQITSIVGTEADLGLAISSSIDGSTITAEVSVQYATNVSDRELVVYLLENGLVGDQTNYFTNLFGGANPISSYVHNHNLVDVWTNIMGDALGSSVEGQEQVINFSRQVPAHVTDVSNLEIVAFVINGSTNEVINAQRVDVGSTQDYQYF